MCLDDRAADRAVGVPHIGDVAEVAAQLLGGDVLTGDPRTPELDGIDHPKVLQSVHGIRVTLDKIDPQSLSAPEVMRAELSRRLGVDVMSYQITALDYITDMARITVFYRKH